MAKGKEKQTRTPRQSKVNPNETKAEKFSRLASARVTKAAKAITNIGNLAGAGYERTPAQVASINKHLQDAVDRVKARFTAPIAGKKENSIKI